MNNKSKTLRALSLSCALGASSLFVGSVQAGSAPLWMPTSGTVNTLDIFLFTDKTSDYQFAIFDDMNDSEMLALESIDTVSFSNTTTGWTATGSNGSINLGDDDHFLFGVLDTRQEAPEWSFALMEYEEESPNVWKLDFKASGSLIAVDVAPVPIPPAALLFGSAVLGLITISRRKKAA